jgi:dihydroxy-acid dehydratase
MKDIDRLSRRVPCLCKVAPAIPRAYGGRASRRRHHGILGELDRAGLIHRDVPTVHSKTLGERSNAGTSCTTP